MLDLSPIYLSLCGFILLISGCATIVNGSHQAIGVSSNPSGASVLVDNEKNLITPARVELKRNQVHTLLFHKDGYTDNSFVLTYRTSGWVWGNLIAGGLIGGFLSGGVDLLSGGARRLSHNSVNVTLAPLSAHSAPLAPIPAVLPGAESLPASTAAAHGPQWTSQNDISAADTQLRNAKREFRAGRMSLEEFWEIKRTLRGE